MVSPRSVLLKTRQGGTRDRRGVTFGMGVGHRKRILRSVQDSAAMGVHNVQMGQGRCVNSADCGRNLESTLVEREPALGLHVP